MFCYRLSEAPPVCKLPALASGSVTFGSFNNLSKIGASTLRLWQSVLLAVPGSTLLLKAAGLGQLGNSEFIRSRLAAVGIDAERVVVRAWTPGVNAHLALYDEVDIGLDTFPFNGATTTCEALLMGVPVVTLAGRTQPSRMGASILSAAGLAHLVAYDEAHYVAIAAAMAADVASLSELRSTMRSRLRQSRLWDRPGFTRDFESLLETALAGVVSGDRAQAADAR
jgi:predicted O-linked N-acetylglucosamine transferase (SPINDLY family)